MSRPRHDSELLPAKERVENAFWALLENREYRKITVTDIVREAQVNRNSFYYHFGSLAELADAAILREVENTSIAQLVDETIDDDGTPLADGKHEDCWVHWLILLGMILSAVYFVGVCVRRRKFTSNLLGYEDKVLGNDRDNA